MLNRLIGSIVILVVVFCAAPAGAADKPNILFIFADDLAYDAVGFSGNGQVKTPALDKLASGGTVFTHAYNMGGYSGAVCISSRMMLNSGRTLWRAGALHDDAEREREAGRWWSEHMKRAGYETYMTGKWHVKASAAKSFDHMVHERPGMPKGSGYERPKADGTDNWSPYDEKFGGFWQGGKHWSEVIADDATAFMEDAAKRDKPFFMYIAFNAPHDPRQAPKEYVDLYPPESIDVPGPFNAEYPYMNQIGCGPNLRDEHLAPHPRNERMMRVHRGEYYAIITHMDAQIARIVDALKKTGKADNTVIIFTADHGLACGHHGLLGKQNMYDPSVRVPWLIAGPGVPAGKKTDTPIYLQDAMATALELAGVGKPEHVEFESVMPLVTDANAKGREVIYTAYLDVQRAVTAGGYKLIVYPKVPIVRLYNLKDDPDEARDLAGEEASKPIIRRLFATLRREQERYDDKLDLSAAFKELAGD